MVVGLSGSGGNVLVALGVALGVRVLVGTRVVVGVLMIVGTVRADVGDGIKTGMVATGIVAVGNGSSATSCSTMPLPLHPDMVTAKTIPTITA